MNVILIVSDTLRRDFLGCYGNEWISTPNIDRFAKKSIVFDRAYAASFPTVPARRDIITGKYSYVYAGWEPLSRDEIVLSEILSKNNFVTMLIADTPHFLRDGYNFQRGFNGWIWIRGQENDNYLTDDIEIKFPCNLRKLRNPYRTVVQYLRNISRRQFESDYFVAKTMSEAVKWLERNYTHEKFFLYVDTFDPHEPWDPPKYYVDLYDPDYDGEEVFYPVYGPADYLSERELKHVRALYAGEVTLVDRWIGRLLDKIEDLDLYSNTMIILTTDHGFFFGEHGLIGKSIIPPEGKFSYAPLYEEIAHIPFILYYPEIKGGWRCDEIIQLPDIFPTILEFVGLKVPKNISGKSIIPLITGERESIHSFAITSPTIIHGAVAGVRTTISTKKWSLIYGGRQTLGKEYITNVVDGMPKPVTTEIKVGPELYDLEKDPGQTNNIYDLNKDIAEKLHSMYIKFLKSMNLDKNILEPWLYLE
ncbi:MAG TPA: hypothetical protein ENG40_02980 [Thermoprotei archaeon]|nr:hypothetical protein [Thermoprotei archaeon]